MLRFLGYGWRNFVQEPDVLCRRLDWEFFAVLRGACAPQVTGQPRHAFKGSTLWLMPPFLEYHWKGVNRRCQRVVIQMSGLPDIMPHKLGQRLYYEVRISESQGRRLLELASEIRPYFYHPDETYMLRVSHLTAELCLMILNQESFESASAMNLTAVSRVQKAEMFYQDHLAQRPTIVEIAAAAGVSESQLRRHFHKVRGKSPQEVFLSLRLKEATRLLLAPNNLSNSVIAESTGFGSTIDFHRSFKKEFGVTPHFWRTHTKSLKMPSDFTTNKMPIHY